jgi:hypothetical protein
LSFDGAQGPQARPLEFVDPPLLHVVQGDGIEVVQLFPAATDGADQVGRLKDGQVLGRGLPSHVEARAQLAEGLPGLLSEQVEQVAPRRIGESLEDRVHTATLCRYLPACQWHTV